MYKITICICRKWVHVGPIRLKLRDLLHGKKNWRAISPVHFYMLTFLFFFLLPVWFLVFFDCPDFTFLFSCIRSDTAAAKEWQKWQLCTQVMYCRTCSSSSAAGFLEKFLLSLNVTSILVVHPCWSSKALCVEGWSSGDVVLLCVWSLEEMLMHCWLRTKVQSGNQKPLFH